MVTITANFLQFYPQKRKFENLRGKSFPIVGRSSKGVYVDVGNNVPTFVPTDAYK